MIIAKLDKRSNHSAKDIAATLKADKVMVVMSPITTYAYALLLQASFMEGRYDAIAFEAEALENFRNYSLASLLVAKLQSTRNPIRVAVYKFPY